MSDPNTAASAEREALKNLTMWMGVLEEIYGELKGGAAGALATAREVLAAPPVEAGETGWLIELPSSPRPLWFSLPGNWVMDAAEALRFARRCDAQAFFDYDQPHEKAFVTEHIWSSPVEAGGVSHDRRWLARQLLDDRLSDAEALGIVAFAPVIDDARGKPAPDPAGLVEALGPFRKAAENLHPAAPDTNIPLAQINVGQWRAFLAALTAAKGQGGVK